MQQHADLQGAIDTLERQLFATQQERESYKTALVQAEHRERLWQSSAEKTGERVRNLEALASGHDKQVSELAARIAELEQTVKEQDGGFKIANEENDRHIARIKALEEALAFNESSYQRGRKLAFEAQRDHRAKIASLEADLRELEGASLRASGLMLKAEKDAVRIAELEAQARDWEAACKRNDAELSRLITVSQQAGLREEKIERLEDELRSARASFDEVARRLVEKEHQLALAKAGIVSLESATLNWKGLDNVHRTRIQALERENREKALELAEKAEGLRTLGDRVRLGDALISILCNYCGERGDNEGVEATLRRIIRERDASRAISQGRRERIREMEGAVERLARNGRQLEEERDALKLKEDKQAAVHLVLRDGLFRENSRLRAAVEDGIAHVERARQGLLDAPGIDPWGAPVIEQLDLAHEVLSGAVAGKAETSAGSAEPEVLWEAAQEDEDGRITKHAIRIDGSYWAQFSGGLWEEWPIQHEHPALAELASRLLAERERRSATGQALDEAKRRRPLILEGIARIEERLHRIESSTPTAEPVPSAYVGDAVVIEKRRHERTGSRASHFYACGPVRATLTEAIRDANRLGAAFEAGKG